MRRMESPLQDDIKKISREQKVVITKRTVAENNGLMEMISS
jgi:hypothetical protein